jgi:hypothetical protein
MVVSFSAELAWATSEPSFLVRTVLLLRWESWWMASASLKPGIDLRAMVVLAVVVLKAGSLGVVAWVVVVVVVGMGVVALRLMVGLPGTRAGCCAGLVGVLVMRVRCGFADGCAAAGAVGCAVGAGAVGN